MQRQQNVFNKAVRVVGQDLKNTPSYFAHLNNYANGPTNGGRILGSFDTCSWGLMTREIPGKKGEPSRQIFYRKQKPATPALLATAASGTLLVLGAKAAANDFKEAKLLTEQSANPDKIWFVKLMGNGMIAIDVALLALLAFSAASLVKRIQEYVKGPEKPVEIHL